MPNVHLNIIHKLNIAKNACKFNAEKEIWCSLEREDEYS